MVRGADVVSECAFEADFVLISTPRLKAAENSYEIHVRGTTRTQPHSDQITNPPKGRPATTKFDLSVHSLRTP